ncbi:NAD(P)-dependent oxidoreductase [Kineosporia mesophila]|uniref:NAD(P)-dependent oxidoreductase n=1 Tax=Kineosporia mesophila TaxID=566012 RepID=A0ABP6ZBT9_9ACTN|nr:NAD(P)-dependent oxidoreductase [Kineosporia mesophila]
MSNQHSDRIRIGFVGLGDIGGPMASRCMAAGFEVTLWARRQETFAQFTEHSYRQTETAAEMGSFSDVVGVAVFSEDDVHEVVLGAGGIVEGMAAGGIILIHSTVTIEFAERLAEQCRAFGIVVMDVPVSGLRARALTGELTVMAGGPTEAYRTVLPMLKAMGSHVHRHGEVGSGLQAKALNQVLLVANMATACLALEAGERLGLNRSSVARTMISATGASVGLDLVSGRMSEEPEFRELATRIAAKDLQAFDALVRSRAVEADQLRAIAGKAFDLFERLPAQEAQQSE